MSRVHVSSGGVVYKWDELGMPLVLLLYRLQTDSWHLPKGTQRNCESLSETAIREIREETGAEVVVDSYLGAVDSEFHRGSEVVKKLTHYYLLAFKGGTVGPTDQEHDCAVWLSIAEAVGLLDGRRPDAEYEAGIVTRAKGILMSPGSYACGAQASACSVGEDWQK